MDTGYRLYRGKERLQATQGHGRIQATQGTWKGYVKMDMAD